MADSNLENKPSAVPSVTADERLAKIEGQLASCWALYTREEYESQFRERVKNEVLSYVTKVGISILVLLGGAGYLFIKSAVLDIYENQNEKIISDLRNKYENNLADQRSKFEWKRNHDYGKNYIYLAEFYASSDIKLDHKRKLLEKQFTRANTYFMYAVRADPTQATTYWELAELHYSYPHDYDAPAWIDQDRALYYYEKAANLYSEIEISRGWRADPYRLIGLIHLERARATNDVAAQNKEIASSQEYLIKARDDYMRAIPESRDYNKQHLEEVEDLIVKINNGKWREPNNTPAAKPAK
jgi:hypothetical protein